MKSIFTKLSTLLVCGAVALVGCSDFSADLKDLNDRFEELAATSATKTQVAELASAIDALQKQIASQYATKEEVAAVATTIEQVKTAYEQAKKQLEAAIDKKADKTELQNAVNTVNTALENAKKEFTAALTSINTTLENLAAEDEAIKASVATVKASVEELLASVTALQTEVETLKANLAALTGSVETLQAELNKTKEDVAALSTDLSDLQTAFTAYQAEVDAQFAAINTTIESLNEALTAEIEALKAEVAKKADNADNAEAMAQITALQTTLSTLNGDLADLAALVSGKADQDDINAAVAALKATLTSDIKALEAVVKGWVDHDTIYDDTALKAAIANATAEYKSLIAGLQSQIDALESAISGIQGEIEAAKSELRAAILVPELLYNGTKAVKFHREEGKNVLKTYATVSYHFNPSNFDASTATYEIVAEQVEVMTKAIFAEEPAIEIIGQPVQEGGKVTFQLERADGAGNMFALKATLANGTVIYSDYAAVIDEATFAVATATSSFEVERLAFTYPSLTSISSIIEYVQSIGTKIEDFESTIQAINAAVEAMQNNDITTAIENLIKIPGLQKERKTIYGTGVFKVQVETLDAEEIIESLKNAQSLDELRKIINDLLGKAQGLGEAGSAIVDGLNNAFGNSALNDLFGQYDDLKNFQLPDLILTYDKAVATLDGYQAELNKARAELQSLQDQLNTIIAGLDPEVYAEVKTLEAEIAELNAQIAELEAAKETASTLEKVKIELQIAGAKTSIETKDAQISLKAGTDYIKIKLELELKESGIKTAEGLVEVARKAVDVAELAKNKAEENLAKLETEILNKVKDYVMENTELGKYLTDLENALGEQAWEGKKQIAAGTAQLFAYDALIADLIKNYNAANQQVVDDFANSLFGRVAYLIQTKEAEDAFELIGLSELYPVLKQLPDLLTLIIKYYPAGVDLTNFTNFNDFGTIFSDFLTGLMPETKVEWEIDYFMAE